jgi:hypothetical protein
MAFLGTLASIAPKVLANAPAAFDVGKQVVKLVSDIRGSVNPIDGFSAEDEARIAHLNDAVTRMQNVVNAQTPNATPVQLNPPSSPAQLAGWLASVQVFTNQYNEWYTENISEPLNVLQTQNPSAATTRSGQDNPEATPLDVTALNAIAPSNPSVAAAGTKLGDAAVAVTSNFPQRSATTADNEAEMDNPLSLTAEEQILQEAYINAGTDTLNLLRPGSKIADVNSSCILDPKPWVWNRAAVNGEKFNVVMGTLESATPNNFVTTNQVVEYTGLEIVQFSAASAAVSTMYAPGAAPRNSMTGTGNPLTAPPANAQFIYYPRSRDGVTTTNFLTAAQCLKGGIYTWVAEVEIRVAVGWSALSTDSISGLRVIPEVAFADGTYMTNVNSSGTGDYDIILTNPGFSGGARNVDSLVLPIPMDRWAYVNFYVESLDSNVTLTNQGKNIAISLELRRVLAIPTNGNTVPATLVDAWIPGNVFPQAVLPSATFTQYLGTLDNTIDEDPNASVATIWLERLDTTNANMLNKLILIAQVWASNQSPAIQISDKYQTLLGSSFQFSDFAPIQNWIYPHSPFGTAPATLSNQDKTKVVRMFISDMASVLEWMKTNKATNEIFRALEAV